MPNRLSSISTVTVIRLSCQYFHYHDHCYSLYVDKQEMKQKPGSLLPSELHLQI